MSDEPLVGASADAPVRDGQVDIALGWYAKQPWLRALIQAVPYAGGSVDTIVAWRGTFLAQRRFEELVENVSKRVAALEISDSRRALLESEEFLQVFQATTEAVVRSASKEKRERAAAFMSGLIVAGTIGDLSQQIADDLGALRDLHLTLVAHLPNQAGMAVFPAIQGAALAGIEVNSYDKGLSDLERFGFIRLDTTGLGTFGGATPQLVTTEYLAEFKRAITQSR